ncbi:MAG: VWA domain-containing protein [Bacteroidota bacterium]
MIRFAHPMFLYGLIAVPVIVLLFILMRLWKRKALKAFGDNSVIQKLFPDVSTSKSTWKMILFTFSFALVIIGIADPQVGTKLEEVKREGIDIVIAIDVSNSMKCEDIRPSRLERAKQSVSKLIDKLQNDRVALIIFAGKAYVQLPLTTDFSAAKLLLNTIDCDMIPTQGTAIGNAIQLAQKSFVEKDKKYKCLILMTDGENHEDDAIAAAKAASEDGIIIHTVGMGSPDGGPIPVYQSGVRVGFRKDNEGHTVVTKLDESMMRQLADAGKGVFVRANNNEDVLGTITKEISRMEKKKFGEKEYSQYEDRFQIFFAGAFLILLIEFLLSERKSKLWRKLNLFGEEKK